MSLKRTLKRFTPPSSPSFHHFEETTYRRFDELERLLREQNAELNQKVAILQKQLAIYGEVLLQDPPGASSFETRKQLFRRLPPATGQFRNCQRVTSRLMQALHDICVKHNLEYWVGYGSLIGAYTRGGPIPWDDDIDVCMHRQSVEKLMEILRDDPDFQVTVVYDRNVLCIQQRFCSRNVNLPAFIDLCVWDYATDYTPEKDERLRQMRLALMAELESADLPYWNDQRYVFDPSSGYIVTAIQLVHPDRQDPAKVKREVAKINRIFQKYTDRAHAEGIFCDPKDATSYAYAFDNVSDRLDCRVLFEKKMIHPTHNLPYEDFEIACPHDTEAFLDEYNANWPYIPNDISLIGDGHIDSRIFDQPEVKQAMKEFLA